MGNGPARHVGAGGLLPIDINDYAVVAHHAELERRDIVRVGDVERAAEVGGDKAIAGWSAIDDRGPAGVTIAQRRGAALPGCVVECGRPPGGSLV